MSSWWENLNTLQTWYARVQWGLGLSALCTAILVVVSFIWNHRIAELRDRQLSGMAKSLAAAQSSLVEADKSAEAAQTLAQTLEAKDAPRSITLQQRTMVLDSLRNSPKGPIRIAAVDGSPESTQFAGEIRQLLSDAGYSVPTVNSNGYEGAPPKGLFMSIKDSAAPPQDALDIRDAFVKAKIPFTTTLNPALEDFETVYVTVGTKPE